MKSKKWGIFFILLSVLPLCLLGGITVFIDPFFHYHGPLKSLEYPLYSSKERYLNDGIVRNFFYDAIITGTSMTENFQASEFNSIFGTDSIKVPISGATYAEINSLVSRALSSNHGIKIILRSFDYFQLFQSPDEMGKSQPLCYLFDNNPLNDFAYILNKEVLFDYTLRTCDYTRSGGVTTSFDNYGCWFENYTNSFDKEIVLQNYPPPLKSSKIQTFTDDMRTELTDKLLNDCVQLALDHPETQFIYFIPPYSLLHWENALYSGTLDQELDAYQQASHCMMGIDNIHLFSFFSDFETTTNLDNYKDRDHYSPEINSLILQRIHDGEYLLTRENCDAHWEEVREFYSTYDYAALRSE